METVFVNRLFATVARSLSVTVEAVALTYWSTPGETSPKMTHEALTRSTKRPLL